MGCTDPCAPNYDAAATADDGTCEAYDDTCNADCTMGDFGGAWDSVACACMGEMVAVNGCTDATADNYNAAANCNDGSCIISDPGCTDPCAPNYDPEATMDNGLCEAYDMTCNADCTMGDFGGIWDAATCACTGETVAVNGCTDAAADNYDAAANCDDGSCMTAPACNFAVGVSAFTCNNGGTLDNPADDTADVTFVVLSNGSSWTSDVAIGSVMAGGDGMMLTETGVAAATVITVVFTSDDDPTCTFTLDYTVPDCTVQIPTLSQWSLITLALLLMIIGSLKLGFSSKTFKPIRKNN